MEVSASPRSPRACRTTPQPARSNSEERGRSLRARHLDRHSGEPSTGGAATLRAVERSQPVSHGKRTQTGSPPTTGADHLIRTV